MAEMLKFEVGRTYRIFGNNYSGRFRAKCVSRTAKTATFEANENGAAWYMPTFTLRAGAMSGNLYAGDLPMEVFVSHKPGYSFRDGVYALADYAID